MQRAVNLIRGWTELQVTGGAPEEFFNLCARHDLGFWAVRKLDQTTWLCRVSFWKSFAVVQLAEASGYEAKILRRGGLMGLLWSLRWRWALLCGLGVCLAALSVLGQTVLSIRVSGNVRVPTAVILSRLRAQGVKPGAFAPAIEPRWVSNRVILDLPELSWMTLNLHGTVCDVVVRERVPRPEVVDVDVPAHIVAKYPGIVTRVQTTRGQQMVEKGQTVAAGDTLIGSWVDFVEPEGYNGDMGGMLVRAGGRVWARTWHTLKAAIPLEGQAKRLTGRETTVWSLEFLGRGVKISRRAGISYDKYDKMTVYYAAPLSIPAALRKEICREYTLEPCPVDVQRAADGLKSGLQQRLDALAKPQEVKRTDWRVEQAGGLLTVTLLAECEQEIGLTVED